jgi:hypothetical protein
MIQILESKPLHLQFKGDRTYLHGSDMYNTITQRVSAFTKDATAYVNKIIFRQLARHDCDLWLEPPADGGRLIANGFCRLGDGSTLPFWVVESERPVEGRYEFDEDAIVSSALFDDRSILMVQRTSYSPIEEIIALNKALNYRLMPKVPGKWLFGQLTLQQALHRDYQKIKIFMKSAISGRFSVSDIEIDEKIVGEIRFVVGKP